jgi:hypothetical protein
MEDKLGQVASDLPAQNELDSGLLQGPHAGTHLAVETRQGSGCWALLRPSDLRDSQGTLTLDSSVTERETSGGVREGLGDEHPITLPDVENVREVVLAA